MPASVFSIWGIAAATVAAIIVRPFRLPEAWWAVIGALLLCVTGLLPWQDALHAVGKGVDVYLFLGGMMIASELARHEGVFDYLAGLAARRARGSAHRLFLLVYGVGTLITVFMSNDATAVVLTPAVLAITRTARVRNPLPYLYACAFVANAASFVLPISNPANLVIFQDRLPSLFAWLARFALPSVCAIGATCLLLWQTQKRALREPVASHVDIVPLTRAGKWTGFGIIAMAIVMLSASALNVALGWPTFLAGVGILLAVGVQRRGLFRACATEISWSVVPLVAGLFVLVEAVERSGAIATLARWLLALSRDSTGAALWSAGLAVTLGSNIANNLPVGLLSGAVVTAAHPPQAVASAILIGVDLGPNLSVTGSLATLLWLNALRREKIEVGMLTFLKVGAVVMFPALIAALAALQFG